MLSSTRHKSGAADLGVTWLDLLRNQARLRQGPQLLTYDASRRALRKFTTPNEKLSPRAPCRRQTPRPVPPRRPHGPTTHRRSKFPGVEVQHRLAAALAPPREALAAAFQCSRRLQKHPSSGTE